MSVTIDRFPVKEPIPLTEYAKAILEKMLKEFHKLGTFAPNYIQA